MSWIALIQKLLPFILQLLALFFGGGAVKSFGDTSSLASAEAGTWVFGQGGLGLLCAGLAHWTTAKQSDWMRSAIQASGGGSKIALSGGIGGLFAFVQLLFDGFTILSRDSEWSKRFKILIGFDVPTTLTETGVIVHHLQEQLKPTRV